MLQCFNDTCIVIMIAVKFDYLESILQKFDDDSANTELFSNSLDFYNLVKKVGSDLPFGHLNYFDATKPADLKLFGNSFLATLVNGETITVRDALDDLKQTNASIPSKFVNLLNATCSGIVNLATREFNSEVHHSRN